MNNRTKLLHVALLVLAPAVGAMAQVPNPDPELERKSFKLDDKFEINLFASDPMIEKPIQVNWDERGRLWCATSQTYPQLAPGKTPDDKIVILEDTTGAGKADKATVFAGGLFIPNAVVPGDGGAYVTNSTEILHLGAGNGPDAKADSRRVVLAGFGTEDTHHIVHTLKWGPDGKLYFIQSIYIHSHLETPRGVQTLLGSGVWRFDTRTLELGVYSRGLVNPWGIVWDKWGQTFETDGAGGEGINYAFPGIGFMSAVGMEKLMPGLNPGSPKYASEEILAGSNMPDDYQGDILTNDFRANRIVRFKLSEDGAGFSSKQMPDFITSSDPAFRPVDLRMGPDGAIYIVDWYNPIIQHGEVDFRDPRRDHTHGRIWRVTAKGKPLAKKPAIEGVPTEQLLDLLKSPEPFDRAQAKLALRGREPKVVLPLLTAWVGKITGDDPDSDHARLEALWTCENLDTVNPDLLARVLASHDGHARAAAVRVLAHWAGQLDNPIRLLEPMLRDEFPRVRLEAVRALAAIPSPQSVVIATRVLDHPMDRFLDYALWLTCNDLQPVWMPAFQSGRLTGWAKPEHLNYALQAVKSPAALKTILAQLRAGQTPADARAGTIDLIANVGGPDDIDALFDLAVNDLQKDPGTRTHLLDALRDVAAHRHLTPRNQPDRLKGVLDDSDPAVRAAALRLAGQWKLAELRPQIIETAESAQTPASVRSAAMDALAAIGDDPSVAELKKLSDAPSPEPTRRLAVAALAGVDPKGAAERAADLLSAGDPDPAVLLAAFSSREGGAEALSSALAGKKIPTDTARLALRFVRSTTSQDPKLVEVLNAAAGTTGGPIRLDADQMRQTIAEVNEKGNAANGERVFRRADTGCYQCHAIDGAGGWLAPDLSSIGASSPMDYLIDSVYDPNKAIKDGYQGYTVVTQSGDAYSGIKVRQDNTTLVLRDNTHLEIPIPLSEVKRQKDIGSLMPNGLADNLTHQEFLDLIKFLSELGKPGPYASGTRPLVRRWRVLDPAPTELSELSTGAPLPASAQDESWPPVYSLVSGALPPDAFATGVALARAQISASGSGRAVVTVNDPKGLSLWVDGKPVSVEKQTTLGLTPGVYTLTFRIDAKTRGEVPLEVEVTDMAGSSSRVQPVGGR